MVRVNTPVLSSQLQSMPEGRCPVLLEENIP